ncbi:PLATZ transcription factor - like 10 [Theobroma cacao]|nr:PLATZ transcription factor - like 10 [Theobroma cacao]
MTSLAALVDLSWLMALLQEKPKFHQSCPCQPSTRQQSFFCKDCMLGFLFCESCKNYSLDHQGHQVLQVFKFTYQQLGIRVSIIKDLFYLSDIEYDNIQNFGQIVYIDRKMQEKQHENNSISSKSGYKSSKECEACGCELQSSTSKLRKRPIRLLLPMKKKLQDYTALISTCYKSSVPGQVGGRMNPNRFDPHHKCRAIIVEIATYIVQRIEFCAIA